MSAIDELKKSMEESGFPLNVKISPYQLRPSDVLNAILELAERLEALEGNRPLDDAKIPLTSKPNISKCDSCGFEADVWEFNASCFYSSKDGFNIFQSKCPKCGTIISQTEITGIQKTKPSIDWSHVSPEYKWLARDEDGLSYLYIEKPECGKSMWKIMTMVTKDCIEIKGYKSYKSGTCDWKDSLVERPEGV